MLDKVYIPFALLFFFIIHLTVSEEALKRLSGEFDLEGIMVLDLSDQGDPLKEWKSSTTLPFR